MTSYNVDICFVCETHLKTKHDHDCIKINGYVIYRRDRLKRKGGGVAFIYKEDHTAKILTDDELNSRYEFIWTLLNYCGTQYICASAYHPPNASYANADILLYLENCITHIHTTYPNVNIIISGDFNQLNSDQIETHTNLTEIVRGPTRGNNFLDRIYYFGRPYQHIKIITPSLKSDHKGILAYNGEVKINHNKEKRIFYIRERKPESVALFREYLALNPTQLNLNEHFDKICDDFYKDLIDIQDRFFPKRKVTLSSADPPFVTPYIKMLLRKRNSFMRRGNILRADGLTETIRKLIINNDVKQLQKIENRPNELWKAVSNLRGKSRTRDIEIPATTLNEHYRKISYDEDYELPNKLSLARNNNHVFFTIQEVHNALSSLKKTATGPDSIPTWFLKLGADFFVNTITDLINMSISESHVPSQWKLAHITPIPKIVNPSAPADYRPISLTSVLSRMTERLIVKKYLQPNIQRNPIYDDQFAFRPTGSTTACVTAITSTITHLLETNKFVRVISFDFSKAFDTVRHSKLFEKLLCLNIPPEIYNWLIDLFSNHTHCTRTNRELSPIAKINAGVIQGSAIGPSAYSIVASDLKTVETENTYIKFADDSYLIIPQSNLNSTDEEIRNLLQWSTENNLKLNVSKSKEIIFTTPKNRCPLPDCVPNIPRINEINILGVTFNSKLSVAKHIADIISKCNKDLYALKIYKHHGLSMNNCHKVFDAKILSKLLYAIQSWWGYANADDKSRISSFISRSAKFKMCNSHEDLSVLVNKREITLFNKILSNNMHVLHRFLPPTILHDHNLRPRRHNRQTLTLTPMNCNNFINRMLLENIS